MKIKSLVIFGTICLSFLIVSCGGTAPQKIPVKLTQEKQYVMGEPVTAVVSMPENLNWVTVDPKATKEQPFEIGDAQLYFWETGSLHFSHHNTKVKMAVWQNSRYPKDTWIVSNGINALREKYIENSGTAVKMGVYGHTTVLIRKIGNEWQAADVTGMKTSDFFRHRRR